MSTHFASPKILSILKNLANHEIQRVLGKLMHISLLQFFKTFHKYVFALCKFWAIYFISAIFWEKNTKKFALNK